MRMTFFSLLGASLLLCITAAPACANTAIDAKGKRHTWSQADIVKVVPPAYPYEVRKARLEGAGLFRLQLDLVTGKVTKATILKSTGEVILDNNALWALRRWQFKPGRWREVEVPLTFTMSPYPVSAPKTRR
jgi:TonB family protein